MRPTYLFPATLLSLGLSSCTFNVISQMHELTETSDVLFSAVHLDASDDAIGDDSAPITVRGSTRSDALARARLAALQRPGSASIALIEGWDLVWNVHDSEAIALQITAPLDGAAWLDALTVEVPSATSLVLTTDSHVLDVSGLEAWVDVQASSGAMEVETTDAVNLRTSSGATHATALAGVIEGDSGSVDFTFASWARVQTTSGAIDGELGDGGRVQSESGAIDLRLTQPLMRDLHVETQSGSIVLDVPEDMPCTLDVTSESGGVEIHFGGVREAGRSLRIDVAGGGPLLQLVSESGSITLTGR